MKPEELQQKAQEILDEETKGWMPRSGGQQWRVVVSYEDGAVSAARGPWSMAAVIDFLAAHSPDRNRGGIRLVEIIRVKDA